MNTGKCPKCEKLLSSVNIEPMDVSQNFTVQWNGVSYLCPFCSSILGVSIDPIALKTDIINGVLDGLGK